MCLLFFLLVFEAEKYYYVGLPGLAGSWDLGFGFREMVGFPTPIG